MSLVFENSFRLFSNAKAASAAALAASLMPRATRAEVLTALFRAEVEHLGQWGRPVIGDTWVRRGDGVAASRTSPLTWPLEPDAELLSESDRHAITGAACSAWCDDGSLLRGILGQVEDGQAIPWLTLLRLARGTVSEEMAETLAAYQHSGVFGPELDDAREGGQ